MYKVQNTSLSDVYNPPRNVEAAAAPAAAVMPEAELYNQVLHVILVFAC
jgi:hypothetical protein